MRLRTSILAIAVALAACTKQAPTPPKNCAFPLSYYTRYGDPPSVAGGPIAVMPSFNKIYVPATLARRNMHDRDVVEWNGTPVSLTMADTYLQRVKDMDPQPSTVLDFPVGAPCKIVIQIRALMEKNLACRYGNRCFQGLNPSFIPTPEPPPTPH
jgi:hypothetical protein